MELDGLPRGQAQTATRMGAGNTVDVQELLGRQHAARGADAHHEAVARLELLPLPLEAHLAIVLLVDAVELEHLLIGGRHSARDGIDEPARDGTAQVIARLLDELVLALVLAPARGGTVVSHCLLAHYPSIHVALIVRARLQGQEVLVGRLRRLAALLGHDFDQGGFDLGGHLLGVAAHVDIGALS